MVKLNASKDTHPVEESSDDASSRKSESSGGTDIKTDNTEGHTDEELESDHASLNIGKDETAAVFKQRLLVFLALFLAALGVSLTVYFITVRSEKASFESQFESTAVKVVESFEAIVVQKFSALASLSVAFTAFARSQNATWPFVTMNDFQQRAATTRSLSDALLLDFVPVVSDKDRLTWENYSNTNTEWIADGFAYQAELGMDEYLYNSRRLQRPSEIPDGLSFDSGAGSQIFEVDQKSRGVIISPPNSGPYFPVWQYSPMLKLRGSQASNFNMAYRVWPAYNFSKLVIGPFKVFPPGGIDHEYYPTAKISAQMSIKAGKRVAYNGDPHSQIFVPIFDKYETQRNFLERPVGVIMAVVIWATYFEDILPPSTQGVIVILGNPCDGVYTYRIDGPNVAFLGEGDLHDSAYDAYKKSAMLRDLPESAERALLGLGLYQDECSMGIQVYPSTSFEDDYRTNLPIWVTLAVALVFVFTAIMFLVYDRLVERRQDLVLSTATQSTAIVSSLFPEEIRDRLMQAEAAKDASKKASSRFLSSGTRLQSFLCEGGDEGAQPIADLFLDCTVIFCDISGFTAWSSTRDPSQVFVLLQTIFQAFDKIAKQHKVFKVETIGDSYVAVTGLPTPQANHAVHMARFAWESLNKFNGLVRELEVSLGPDTGELAMRFGIHSGPVTAGVLRGERSRFQLFGDTVNTAARIERQVGGGSVLLSHIPVHKFADGLPPSLQSTGMRNSIHVSEETATLLIAAGMGHWIRRRKDLVTAKGKGDLVTYWLTVRSRGGPSRASETEFSLSAIDMATIEEASKEQRLVGWATEVLLGHIKAIVARRQVPGVVKPAGTGLPLSLSLDAGSTCLDEVAEIIEMPKFDEKLSAQDDPKNVVVPEIVVRQLKKCVATLASTYRNNPFHNFEHACHVTMAVDKFMKRIVAPNLDPEKVDGSNEQSLDAILHAYTHGITSDPLTLFAIVFSALIHDSDHRGVGNGQLIKEDPELGEAYKGKSVAEQNSLDISWEIFMADEYKELRDCIFSNSEAELKRFRQVIVNVVLATDIFDKELNDLRKGRWNKAFAPDAGAGSNDDNLRATIVIEHIIQASDVSHTMQHWHIYRKWNERLFREMHQAYRQGRMGKDPTTFWYQGELGFFDNYIIPLAKKLKECNVFGVSSDECLVYATQNRLEWERRGNEVIAEMIQNIGNQFDVEPEEDEADLARKMAPVEISASV